MKICCLSRNRRWKFGIHMFNQNWRKNTCIGVLFLLINSSLLTLLKQLAADGRREMETFSHSNDLAQS